MFHIQSQNDLSQRNIAHRKRIIYKERKAVNGTVFYLDHHTQNKHKIDMNHNHQNRPKYPFCVD